ncbi:MAG: hypothetical protein E7256_14020 [Lachnospiraceae bacterium]|nr:hypothetical protein [Lachnospiraceae bacterium]
MFKKQDEKNKKEKKKLGQSIKASFTNKKFKGGAYATAVSAIMIVIVLVVNLFISELDLSVDLTSDGRYTLDEQTKELLKGIDENISIYYLVQSGSEYDEFRKVIDQFDDYNSKVSVTYKDPVQYPKFASQYVEDNISEQSFLVVNEDTGRAKYVDYSEVLVTSMNYSTYQQSVTALDIEGRIDSAIQYVTNEDLPVIYAVGGHGENDVTSTMSSLLEKENIDLNTVSTLTAEEIPSDCDVLFISMPQTDYTQEEVEMIKTYLKNGGKAIINVDYVTPDLLNFTSLVEYYGVKVTEGIVVEPSSSYYRGNYKTELVPAIATNDYTEGVKGKKFVICPISSGLTLREDIRDTITTTPILTSSDEAYSKVNVNAETTNKESGDVDGPFYFGLEVAETYNDVETKIIFYSGKYMFDDSYISMSTFGNATLFINTINALCDQENAISVPSLSLQVEYLTMTSAQKNTTAAVVGIVIPLIVLGAGILVVVNRRKK